MNFGFAIEYLRTTPDALVARRAWRGKSTLRYTDSPDGVKRLYLHTPMMGTLYGRFRFWYPHEIDVFAMDWIAVHVVEQPTPRTVRSWRGPLPAQSDKATA